jgi:hypothetical protein
VPVYSCFDAYELMFMSKEFTDPDIIELAADTRVEHSVEVIVAIRTVQQSQLQFPCASALFSVAFFIYKMLSS